MIISAAKWQTASTLVTFILSLVQLIFLARVFNAEAFGYLAIVTVCINIYQTLSDLGMANYLIYIQQVSKKLNATVFWVCSVAGGILCLFMLLSAEIIANYYQMQELTDLLSIAAYSLIPISLGAQIQARYMLEYKLPTLAKFDIISKLISTTFVLYSVSVLNMGITAVVFGVVLSALVRLALLFMFADKAWLPTFMFNKQDAQKAWKYGKFQVGSQILNKIREDLDIIILGLFIETSKLGFYSLAKQLAQKISSLIVPIVRKLTLPLIARSQNDSTALKDVVYSSHYISTLFLIFPHILLLFVAEQVTLIFYGQEKIEVAIFLFPLTIFYMLRSVGGALAGSICQGLGKTNVDFYWNLSVFVIYALLAFLSSQFGAIYTAYSYALIQVFLLNFVYFVFYKKNIGLSYSGYITPILSCFFISLSICLAFIFFLKASFFTSKNMLLSNIIYVVMCSVVYFLYCLKKLKKMKLS